MENLKIKYWGSNKIIKIPVEVLKYCGDGLFIHHPWISNSENFDKSLYKVSTIKGYGCSFAFNTLKIAEEYAENLKKMIKGWGTFKISHKFSKKTKEKFRIIKRGFLRKGGVLEKII